MYISIEFGSYNFRRYGRPWGAILTFDAKGKPQYEFVGSYLGSDRGGELVINAEPGDLIAYGQRDHRGGNTENHWAIVTGDETAEEPYTSVSRSEAFKYFLSRQAAKKEEKSDDLAGGSDL